MSFTHLHVHTEYSLLDGACRIKELAKAAKTKGFDSLAITDHGVMYGAVDFYRACKSEGIRPVIGCEVYVAPGSRFDKTSAYERYHHMVLLCENQTGYQNLIKLVSLGFTEGFYAKPRIDDSLLEQYHEGLICLSACLAGAVPTRLLSRDYSGAKEKAIYYRDLFGADNFFIELQNHGIKEEKQILPDLVRLAGDIGVGLVCTNDCHYIEKSDSSTHDILLCIQTNSTVNDANRMKFETDEFYLKTEDEMRELFGNYPEALENTHKLAMRCNVEFTFGERKLPDFPVPNGEEHLSFFRRQCFEGLRRRFGESPDEALKQRLEYEISVIDRMGFVDYFLIVGDFVSYAKRRGIPVGPGRGSGAGSLCAYCMGITDVDPIKYNLIFERFLNPERVSMPDFDIDFCSERKKEVIDYVTEKYGADHVAQIISFGTMGAKQAIRDAGRALAASYSATDAIAKLVPTDLNTTLDSALKASEKLRSLRSSDETADKIITIASKLEGMPRHVTIHAAGVVITDKPVYEYVPLSRSDSVILTQFPMTTLEELGLLKMDFLSLTNLTVIAEAERLIRVENPGYSQDEMRENDPEVFKMISLGLTEGVFQFESAGMKNVLSRLRPDCIEDLIAVLSLYRPGPMDSIPTYIKCRHDPSLIKYKHPRLKNILEVTYGCIVYQEQVMQIFRELAGYSLGRADIVRRAMSKKKHDVMSRERDIFINGLTDENGKILVEGCLRRGVSAGVAEDIFSEMESFASYAFNKSHAAAYSLVSYKTAWLKCKYPRQYMAALLSSELGNLPKTARYIRECNRLGIKVLPPDINESSHGFSVSGKNIRFGLMAVKNIGKQLVDEIIRCRCSSPYRSLYDFCKRVYGKNLNIRAVESLIKCGAFDYSGANRRQLLTVSQNILNDVEYEARHSMNGQISIFDMGANEGSGEPKLPEVPGFSAEERLQMEYETTGMYLSGHPMDGYSEFARYLGADSIGDIISDDSRCYRENSPVRVVGMISKLKTQNTRTGKLMAFATVEDKSGAIETVVFPNVYTSSGIVLNEKNVVVIRGKVTLSDDRPKIICDSMEQARTNEECDKLRPAAPQKPKKPPTLYLRIDDLDTKLFDRAKRVLDIFEGRTPVIFSLTNSNRRVLAPQSMWVSLNDVMIRELKYQLGEHNVVVK